MSLCHYRPQKKLCFYTYLSVHRGGGMCGRGKGMRGRGTCIAGGMCCRGHICGMGRAWHARTPQQLLRDMVNEQVVRILLECILVGSYSLDVQCSLFMYLYDTYRSIASHSCGVLLFIILMNFPYFL